MKLMIFRLLAQRVALACITLVATESDATVALRTTSGSREFGAALVCPFAMARDERA
jgi:hypothetical protein